MRFCRLLFESADYFEGVKALKFYFYGVFEGMLWISHLFHGHCSLVSALGEEKLKGLDSGSFQFCVTVLIEPPMKRSNNK